MKNKYDTNITLEDNSSLTYILKNIKFGSTVLEFGPATGYMTKYLKEEMQCKVYIVEIDREAFEKANAFAQDGVCGSAEDRTWCEKFQSVQFDYITFADVLEHLVNPWQVLKWSVELLKKDTGKVLISIPNIGHNAVMIELFNNKFEYRKTGIMDNTHLRFFTHDSAAEMFHQCGLYIVHEDAVVFDLEYAGFGNSASDVTENVWEELRLREYGYVNQFLFTLETKEPIVEPEVKKGEMSYESALYYANDSEYCEEQKIIGTVRLSGNRFCAEFLGDKEVYSSRMMIELFSFPGKIKNIEIESNDIIEHIQPINGKKCDDYYYFWGDDIKIQVECLKVQRIEYVRISGELGTIQIKQLGQHIISIEKEQEEKLIQKDLEIQRLNQVIEKKDVFTHEVEEEIQRLNQVIEKKDVFTHEVEEEIQRLNQVIEEKVSVIQSEEAEIRRLNQAIEEKDSAIQSEEAEVRRLNQVIEEKDSVIQSEEAEIGRLNQVVEKKENYIQKIEATKWFCVFGKRMMKEK